MSKKNNKNIRLLSEMVDSYNMLHSDLLKTDSISEAEHLQSRLKLIEKDILAAGACINLSIARWETFLLNVPEVSSYGDYGKEIIREALKYVVDKANYNILEKLYAFEDAILASLGKHKALQEFYEAGEIMEQKDSETVIKHVTFREYIFIKDQALNLLKENIKAI